MIRQGLKYISISPFDSFELPNPKGQEENRNISLKFILTTHNKSKNLVKEKNKIG